MKPGKANNDLTRFAWLSILAAVITIGLKVSAYFLTNSISLLSDAMESVVNLATAIVALIALRIAAKPADDEFSYGYSKAEFFSSGFEGGMILIAAGSIIATAVPRLIHPQPLEKIGLGLGVSIAASIVNWGVSLVLTHAARLYGSVTLEADARHLMTDVITTAGVIAGVGLVSLTGWQRLDAIIALLVAGNILFTGFKLLKHAALGLLDVALPKSDLQVILDILKPYESDGITFHDIRSRSAAARGFVSMHVLVPGDWSVQKAHDLAEQLEIRIHTSLPQIMVFTHVEPAEDPASLLDKGWSLRQ